MVRNNQNTKSTNTASHQFGNPGSGSGKRGQLVWELPIRVFHGLFALSVIGALVSTLQENWLTYHAAFGMSAMVLAAFRIGWGFVGGRYARFSGFLKKPSVVIEFAKGLFRRKTDMSVGHNPLAGWVMAGMIFLPVFSGITGLALLGGQEQIAPWSTWFTSFQAIIALPIHKLLALGIIGLVSLHLVGIALHTILHREPIALAMLHGRKRFTGAIPNQAWPSLPVLLARRGLGIATVIAGFVLLGTFPFQYTAAPTAQALEAQPKVMISNNASLVRQSLVAKSNLNSAVGLGNAHPSPGPLAPAVVQVTTSNNQPYSAARPSFSPPSPGNSVLAVDSGQRKTAVGLETAHPSPGALVWQQECGSCHLAFHPSLLPAQSWAVMMDELEDHFGDNAWVDDQTKAKLTGYARMQAADQTNSEVARLVRSQSNPDGTDQKITELEFWKTRHQNIRKEDYQDPRVKGRLDCKACHPYAAFGSFEDSHIRFPFGPNDAQ